MLTSPVRKIAALLGACLLLGGCGARTSPPWPVAGAGGSPPSGPPPGGSPPEPWIPGDCHAPPGTTPTELFSPADVTTSDVPGGTFVLLGGEVYAALLSSAPAGTVELFSGSTSGGGLSTFATIDLSAYSFMDGPFAASDRVLWWQTPVSGDFGPVPTFAVLGYGTVSGGEKGAMPAVTIDVDSTAYAADGETLFAFTCSNHQDGLPACDAPGATWTMTATDLASGNAIWTQTVPGADVEMHTKVVVDAGALYWHSSLPSGSAERILTMPRGGGAEVEVPAGLGPGESVWWMGRDAQGLVILALGPRDAAITDEVILYRVPLPSGMPARVSLGRTYEEALFATMDAASVYFTLDAPPGADLESETRTLMRVCKDGTNPVTVLTAMRWGTDSMQDLALDAARLYFTANNGVHALGK